MSHEWIRVEENIGTVGISDHAQKELGEIVYIELPQIGQLVKEGEEVCVLESTKAAADVYSPASGKVIAVNESVRQTPSLINRAAESSGWLYKIELLVDPE
ncbi:MAG: glycine cleavage system protein GcvH [Chlamydiales bacterium]|nr:glycine cleavage system protein GcvH [Chlamydiales bacterium]